MTKRLLHIYLAATSALLCALPGQAEKAKNILDIKSTITDSNIIFPESYEVDTQKMMEGWYLKNYTATDDRYKRQGDTNVSDDVIRDRLSKMNTIIDMPFNQIVRSYIDRYTVKSRGAVSAMLGLSIYYMPIFEQALEEEGLPLELKYLPVIESALNPNATSRSGAAGLWQFMLITGKGMDMEISSLVDERRDPYLSSKKAAKLLKDLYKTYNDWSLAIAAYNCGPGTVNKALRRAGGDSSTHDFWSIYYYLPAETRGYVPQFIAANYVMTYYPYHNISPVLATKPLVTDTLMISNRVHFNQISKVLDIPLDELRVLNPQFRADIIPGRPEKMYTLVLPSQQIHAYLMSEEDILNYDRERYAQRMDAQPGQMPGSDIANEIENEAEAAGNQNNLAYAETPLEEPVEQVQTPVRRNSSQTGMKTVSHKVEPGETLSSIAEKYNVSTDDIKTWNDMSRSTVRTGQHLKITTTAELADASGAREVAPAKKSSPSTATAKSRTTQTETKSETKSTAQNKNTAKTDKNTAKTDKNTTKADKTTAKTTDKNTTAKKSKSATKNDKNSKNSKSTKKAETQKAATSHSVKSGENLSTIAKKHGVSVEELKKANNLKDDKLLPGDNLKLPTKGKSSSKSGSKSGTSKSSKSSATKSSKSTTSSKKKKK